MDVEESCLQFNINDGWVGRQDITMNFIIDWRKRKNRKKKIKAYIKNSIKYGDFTGTSGEKLNYYIDCRPLIANSSIRVTIIKALYELIDIEKDIIFAGPQTSGAILATEMALFKNTHAIIFNLNKNEVILPYNIDLSNKKIILVDDVFTTGSTLKKCIDLLNFPIYKIFCIVNRSKIYEVDGVEVNSVLSLRDIDGKSYCI